MGFKKVVDSIFFLIPVKSMESIFSISCLKGHLILLVTEPPERKTEHIFWDVQNGIGNGNFGKKTPFF